MNILYIAPLDYVHDIKWMGYFSSDRSNKVFVVAEKDTHGRIDDAIREDLERNHIRLLPPLANFSARKFMQTWKSIRLLRRYLRDHNIQVVHALFACPQALWLSFLDTPSMITTRGSDALLLLPGLLKSTGIRGLQDRLLFSLFRRSFRKATFITSTSTGQITAIEKTFGIRNKLHLVRSGIDVSQVSASSAPEHLPLPLQGKKFVFSPRFMSPVYNIELQALTIRLLSEEVRKKYCFAFIKSQFSDPAYAGNVIDILKSIPGLDFVILDLLNPQEMYACFKQTSLTLITPLSDGTPNTALEAMAARSPLILGSYSYDRDLFDGTCMKLGSNDPATLATGIEQALSNYPEGMLDKAENAVNLLGNREKEMQKLRDLYTQMAPEQKKNT